MGNFKSRTLDTFKQIISGRFNLPTGISVSYWCFVIFLVFLYITNHLSVERDLRRISELKTETKELRYESITTSSELMNMSKQSEVIRRIDAEGLDLKELTEPPRIIKKK